MCLSPLKISNNSVYKNDDHSFNHYVVPCGNCAECRDIRKNEWQTRVAYEVHSLYKRGGKAIFLTFTYNDDNLPYYNDPEASFTAKCFNREHVTTFLNRLKVGIYRAYGKGSYKYFFTSEYGKNTKRPHYHCIFFLEPTVDANVFAFTARDCWTYGFMFPRFDYYRKMWVDSDNQPFQIEIKSKSGISNYAAKYVCKDLSYFELDDIKLYLSDKKHRERMRPFLPKHWQSNGIGESIFTSKLYTDGKFDVDKFCSAYKNGVLNPLTKEYDPLPSYVVNKVIYDNISTKGTPFERVSPRTGKFLYDRLLSDVGKKVHRLLFDVRIDRTCQKLQKFFLTHKLNSDVYLSINSCNIDLNDRQSFVNLALYRSVVRFCDYKLLQQMMPFSLNSKLPICQFDIDACYDVYKYNNDIALLRSSSKSNRKYLSYKFDFCYLDYLSAFYEFYSIQDSINRLNEYNRKKEIIDYYKYKYDFKFDKKLC